MLAVVRNVPVPVIDISFPPTSTLEVMTQLSSNRISQFPDEYVQVSVIHESLSPNVKLIDSSDGAVYPEHKLKLTESKVGAVYEPPKLNILIIPIPMNKNI